MNNKIEQYNSLLSLAEKAAILAGDFLREERRHLLRVTDEPVRDVKLKADRESEEHIIEILKANSPYSILSEEIGLVSSAHETEFRWIIDPLDGSVNYLQGLPICCVSIALWKDDSPLLGVVFDFLHGNLYKGIVSVGACLNGASFKTGGERPAAQAILCTGFPVSMDFSCDSLKTFVKHVRCFKKVRLFGSAAMSLAFVASGRADAYYEKNIKIWDVAAGLALVKAAGGAVDVRKTSVDGIVDVYAGTGLLRDYFINN